MTKTKHQEVLDAAFAQGMRDCQIGRSVYSPRYVDIEKDRAWRDGWHFQQSATTTKKRAKA